MLKEASFWALKVYLPLSRLVFHLQHFMLNYAATPIASSAYTALARYEVLLTREALSFALSSTSVSDCTVFQKMLQGLQQSFSPAGSRMLLFRLLFVRGTSNTDCYNYSCCCYSSIIVLLSGMVE